MMVLDRYLADRGLDTGFSSTVVVVAVVFVAEVLWEGVGDRTRGGTDEGLTGRSM